MSLPLQPAPYEVEPTPAKSSAAPRWSVLPRSFDWSDVTLEGDTIGRGSTGRVELARWTTPGEETTPAVERYLAVKIVERNCEHNPENATSSPQLPPLAIRRLEHEQRLLTRLDHPGVVKILGRISSPSSVASLLRLYPYGSLSAHIRHHARRLMPLSRVRQYMVELIHIVGYLHSRGVAHRDLTSRNVVIDERGRLVVIDFGMARSTGEEEAEGGLPYAADEGTLAFLAPERLSKAASASSAASSSSSASTALAFSKSLPVDEFASDCWSLGILLYEMLFGSLPFQGADEAAVGQAILAYRDDDDEAAADGGSFLSAREFPPRSSLNKDALDLLSKLMRRDPTQRLSIMAGGGDAIQRHPFFHSQQATIAWQLSEDQNFGASMWSTPSPVEFARHLGALDPEVDAAAAQSAVHIDLDEK